jgi:hypothetical protein
MNRRAVSLSFGKLASSFGKLASWAPTKVLGTALELIARKVARARTELAVEIW